MRIACLQFSPQVGEVEKNMSKADAVLAASASEQLDQGLDLLILPEMSFSAPYLESPSTGPTSSWAKQKAQSFRCTVAVGYPELQSHTNGEYYNSLLVVNPSGNQVANYRKSFLYYTDATWAREGPGFYSDSPESTVFPGKTTAMGICMDINPYNFTNPWNLYEFARHCSTVKANLVIISMAWLTLEMRERFLTGREDEPDLETIAYWVGRLEPLIRGRGGHAEEEEIIIVFANRCGWEDEAVYAGSSAVMGVKGGEVSVYGVLGRGVEELLVVDTDGEPRGRLVTKKRDENEEEEEEEKEEEEEEASSEKQQENPNNNEKSPNGPSQPQSNSSNSNKNNNNNNSPSQPPSSTHNQNQTQLHQKPKLTLLTDPHTIPPFRSVPQRSMLTTPQTLYRSPTTPSPLWSISPYTSNPFSDKNATSSDLTSFPVSFSSFCFSPLSPHSLPSLDDADEFFEAWLVSPVSPKRQEKPRLGYWEEERLQSWKWPNGNRARFAGDVDDGEEDEEEEDDDEDVSPKTSKREEMIRIMVSPSCWADLQMPHRCISGLVGGTRRVEVKQITKIAPNL
uniref:N-terminal amidase n=1 Tax=Podospora anserina (strain S / ATCC MYA-4624 / DSM 980 / FGSC 10383) TaxID=515849 RepID=A0A090CC18_PODAN|nr:Putative N-terminal amidase [Podospora anserina S mat+]